MLLMEPFNFGFVIISKFLLIAGQLFEVFQGVTINKVK